MEGREIVSHPTKVASLAHMISAMHPDIDHAGRYVHNDMARVFSDESPLCPVSPHSLPFLKSICHSNFFLASPPHWYLYCQTDRNHDGLCCASPTCATSSVAPVE